MCNPVDEPAALREGLAQAAAIAARVRRVLTFRSGSAPEVLPQPMPEVRRDVAGGVRGDFADGACGGDSRVLWCARFGPV